MKKNAKRVDTCTMLQLLAATFLMACATCCHSDQAPTGTAAQPERVVAVAELGVMMVLPAHWQVTSEQGTVVASGEPGTEAFYTTITLQSAASEVDTLDTALTLLFKPLAEHATAFTISKLEPATVCGNPTLRYQIGFSWYDAPRVRIGALIDTRGGPVDLALASVAPLQNTSLDIFEDVLADLHCFAGSDAGPTAPSGKAASPTD